MLQWMGGSRRKVTASRKSTQKRQKQYFEQRKRQQQNVQMMGSDNPTESSGIGGEILKEHMSLDILNLLNLSKTAQECNSFCQKGKDDGDYFSGMPGSVSTNQPKISTKVETTVNACGFEEEKAGAPVCCQGQPSPKKVSLSAPDHQSTAFDGPSSHCKTATDQYSELSVIDFLFDDELNPTVEKSPTCEDHVSFSLEGLGKVGTKTPVHSPQQRARIPCRNSSLLKDGRKTKYRNLSHVLDDIELEVDTMMQDIGVSPISSSFPSNKLKHRSAVIEDHKSFYDNNDKNGSSISEEFFSKTENNEDTWNACSLFLDEKFDIGMGYDTSYKKAFQMDCTSPELLKRGANKMECYDFEDLLPVKWPSATVRKDINMGEPLASFSTDQLEDDFNFCGSGRTRLYGNFNAQNLIPEDVRDGSSLLSEESSSSTVVRGDFVVHSPSRLVTGENRRKHRNVFASPRHKYSNNEEKNRSRSNPSKQKPSYYSNSFLQEEMGAQNSRKFEERYASVDRSSVTTSFYQDLEANFSFFGGKNSAEDPFSVNTTPEYKTSPSFDGFKNAATLEDSPPCSFTSEKFSFDCLTAFPSFPSWPTGPCLSPDFQFKEGPQDCVGFHCETSSTDMSVQGSVNKEERQMKLQKDYFEQEGIFMGDNELSSEKKMAVDAPTSNNHEQESEGTEDTNPKTTECHETADSPVLVEEISSPLKIPDKHESQVDNRKSNSDAETETPLKCKIANKGQVMYESYVFHMRVQKVLNGACTISRRNNAFLKPGCNRITHQI
ncbi:uncharacterized protein [Cicer arietinum]|uniref:Uncharacterized protein LOC101506096 isoform X3 n=1 Tax=Cicer arietinum TaxID=3827 RepID=A0A1S3E643_CICAR|nr:uncharacterized protein LOC101506096 isoform X3 [Cicer arietinum]